MYNVYTYDAEACRIRNHHFMEDPMADKCTMIVDHCFPRLIVLLIQVASQWHHQKVWCTLNTPVIHDIVILASGDSKNMCYLG